MRIRLDPWPIDTFEGQLTLKPFAGLVFDVETDRWEAIPTRGIPEAVREVLEETGIDCAPGSELADALLDWQLENVYEIYPRWRYRYAPGVTRNTEHLFGLRLPETRAVRLSPREHTAAQWLPYQQAASACFSPSNAEAILMLPRFATPGASL